MTGWAPKTNPRISLEMTNEGDKRQKGGGDRVITETKGEDNEHSLAPSFLRFLLGLLAKNTWGLMSKILVENLRRLLRMRVTIVATHHTRPKTVKYILIVP